MVDVESHFHADESENTSGKVARILENVYHADGRAEDENMNKSNSLLDLGPEDPVENEKSLIEKVKKAQKAVLFAGGYLHLKELLHESRDSIKLKPNAENPALIEPLRVKVESDAVPIRAKQRGCPLSKKEFLVNTFGSYWNSDSPEKVTAPNWICASSTVLKRSLAVC